MFRIVRAPCGVILTLLTLASPARASDVTLETFDACWSLVQRRFYDDDLHGVDWQRCRELFRPLAAEAQPGACERRPPTRRRFQGSAPRELPGRKGSPARI